MFKNKEMLLSACWIRSSCSPVHIPTITKKEFCYDPKSHDLFVFTCSWQNFWRAVNTETNLFSHWHTPRGDQHISLIEGPGDELDQWCSPESPTPTKATLSHKAYTLLRAQECQNQIHVTSFTCLSLSYTTSQKKRTYFSNKCWEDDNVKKHTPVTVATVWCSKDEYSSDLPSLRPCHRLNTILTLQASHTFIDPNKLFLKNQQASIRCKKKQQHLPIECVSLQNMTLSSYLQNSLQYLKPWSSYVSSAMPKSTPSQWCWASAASKVCLLLSYIFPGSRCAVVPGSTNCNIAQTRRGEGR